MNIYWLLHENAVISSNEYKIDIVEIYDNFV